MLVLTRRPGESIQIGSDITVTVIEVSGNQIKLGINAPRDVLVLREELTLTTAVSQSPEPDKER